MRVRVVAASVAVLALTAGCRETQWPSAADPQAFCEQYAERAIPGRSVDDTMVRLGTPANLPYEARRYVLDLEDGEADDPVGEQALETYLSDYC